MEENKNNNGPEDQKELNPGVVQNPGPLDQKDEKKDDKKDDKKKKTVEVDSDVLERLLTTVENQGKKIEILTEVADKGRLNRVEEMRSQGKLVKKVNLNTYDGKIIIGWQKVKDDVYMDHEGRLHEDQIVGLVFKGETKVSKELDVRSFSRLIKKIPAEVLEESKDRDGNTNFLLQTPEGEEIKIDARFIN